MPAVGVEAEREFFLFGGLALFHMMEFVLAEEAAVVVADVCVPAGAIRAVVGDLTLKGDGFVRVHNKFNIIR